jgi:hypothetical protein
MQDERMKEEERMEGGGGKKKGEGMAGEKEREEKMKD